MGKHYDIKNDVKRLLLADLQEPKARKLERRITTWVFEGSIETQFDRLLAVITTACKIGTVNQQSPRAQAIERTTAALRNALSVRIIDTRNLQLMLRLTGHEMRLAHQRKISGRPIDSNQAMHVIENHATIWFLRGCYQYIGATLDRSMSFALYLLELEGNATQEQIDGKVVKNDFDDIGFVASCVLRICAAMTPGEKVYERKWLDQLIEHNESDETVWETWKALGRILDRDQQSSHTTLPIAIADESDDTSDTSWSERIEDGALCVSPRQYAILQRRGSQIKEKIERNNADCQERIAWIAAHEEQMKERTGILRSAIMEHARRGLRPAGFDHIDINVTLMYEIGFRSIAFYPEGCIAPETGIHCIMRGRTPHLLIYKTEFRNFTFTNWNFLSNRFPDAIPLFRVLCEYVVTDILWRLMVGEKRLRQKKNGNHESVTSGAHGTLTPRRPVHVSVTYYKRNLPAGQQASEEAKMEAAKVGWKLNAGETFVRDFDYNIVPATYQGGRIVHQLPTEAFATYGDADLLEGIGGTP